VSIGHRGGSSADGERARSSVRVLVVDDAPSFRRVICELLERRGYRVVGQAASATEAIELTDRLQPDAVLLDVNLPDLNGFALAARLTRAHPDLAVLLTSLDFESNFYALADASGARGFMPKADLAAVEFMRFWPRSGRP
jgi:DNA-binding NarL/FixJ family response regulator